MEKKDGRKVIINLATHALETTLRLRSLLSCAVGPRRCLLSLRYGTLTVVPEWHKEEARQKDLSMT